VSIFTTVATLARTEAPTARATPSGASFGDVGQIAGKAELRFGAVTFDGSGTSVTADVWRKHGAAIDRLVTVTLDPAVVTAPVIVNAEAAEFFLTPLAFTGVDPTAPPTVTVAGDLSEPAPVDIEIIITTRGKHGTAEFTFGEVGGEAEAPVAIPANGVYSLAGVSLVVTFADGTYEVDDTYTFTVDDITGAGAVTPSADRVSRPGLNVVVQARPLDIIRST